MISHKTTTICGWSFQPEVVFMYLPLGLLSHFFLVPQLQPPLHHHLSAAPFLASSAWQTSLATVSLDSNFYHQCLFLLLGHLLWRSPCLELLIPPLAFQTSYLYMQPILIVCATLTHLPHMARSWLGPSPGLCMPIHNLGPAPFPKHWPSANAIHWCSPLLTNVVTQLLMFLNHMDFLNSYPFTVEQIIW